MNNNMLLVKSRSYFIQDGATSASLSLRSVLASTINCLDLTTTLFQNKIGDCREGDREVNLELLVHMLKLQCQCSLSPTRTRNSFKMRQLQISDYRRSEKLILFHSKEMEGKTRQT